MTKVAPTTQAATGEANAANNLGITLAGQNNLDAALVSFHRAVALNPNLADGYNNIALVHAMRGEAAKTIEYAHKALSINPLFAKAHNNLGNGYLVVGDHRAAGEAFRKALALDPKLASANRNLCIALFRSNRYQAARDHALLTLRLHPDMQDAKLVLAESLRQLHQFEEAYTLFAQLNIGEGSTSALVFSNMGSCALEMGRAETAKHHFQQALKVDPNNRPAMIGVSLCDIVGKPPLEARRLQLDLLAKVRLEPNAAALYSRLLFQNIARAGLSADENFADHRQYSAWFEQPHRPWHAHTNAPTPTRRLRVGYVSGDFFNHSVARFFLPILRSHDPAVCETVLFSNREFQDETSRELQLASGSWLNCFDLSDEELAVEIRRAGIDILVDLSGHSAYNRLPVFARKPAPIQATWIGVAGTTGLSAIDYRLTDPVMDPPGLTEQWHTEKLVRLATPLSLVARPANLPPVNPPARFFDTDMFTFASLNQLYKLNIAVVEAWATILHSAPRSRLLVCHVNTDSDKQLVHDLLRGQNIEPSRIILFPTMAADLFLEFLDQVDLALDSFPYNGGTTSVTALWMGVPTLTLLGNSSISRVGAATALSVGLDKLVAESTAEYVATACAIANDHAAHLPTKLTLRERLEHEHMTAAAKIGASLMRFYRDAWVSWCRNEALDTRDTYS
jgi:protein O-GlcNAc transferase